MKFQIVRTKFLDALKSVQNIVVTKGSLPILQNVLMEANGGCLKLTTTDLDISINASVECEIEQPGATTLPVKILLTAVTKCPEGMIEMTTDESDRAVLRAGTSTFKLNGRSDAEFPKMNSEENSCEYNLDGKVIREMLRRTSYAAAQDDTRRTLKGVLMSFKDGKLTMVATDGRRLALVENEVEFPVDSERDIVLPSKAVQELLRAPAVDDKIRIVVGENRICFDLGKTQISSKLMEETYPNYRQVIPTETAQRITIDRQLLLDALDRASVMTMDEAHSTKLVFDMNSLVVTSTASDIGEAMDTVPIKYAGEKIEIMFNPNYVMDPLKAIDEDEIVFNLNDGHSPAVISCAVPFIYVLMPLRIN